MEELFKKIKKDNVKFIQLQFSDIMGIAKSLTIPLRHLTVSLNESLEELKKDSVIQAALGKHIYEKFMSAKSEECDKYRQQVSKWELDRYLEVY